MNAAGSSLTISVDVTGSPDRAPTLREDMTSAITGENELSVSAKTVQAYVTGRLVRSLGGTIAYTAGPQGVNIMAVFAEPMS